MRRTHPRHGFALTELIIAIIIISVLANISYFSYQTLTARAATSRIDTALRSLDRDVRSAASANGTGTPAAYLTDAVDAFTHPTLTIAITSGTTVTATDPNGRCRQLTVSTPGGILTPGTLSDCPPPGPAITDYNVVHNDQMPCASLPAPIAIPMPAAAGPGDLLLFVTSTGNQFSAPAGWTVAPDGWRWKWWDPADPATFTFTPTGIGCDQDLWLIAVDGIAAISPIIATNTSGNITNVFASPTFAVTVADVNHCTDVTFNAPTLNRGTLTGPATGLGSISTGTLGTRTLTPGPNQIRYTTSGVGPCVITGSGSAGIRTIALRPA
jgi:prepilin-type N-terminal cleavage/methylation domain-containing protein